MCQVHTGAYVSLLKPGKTDYTACHQARLPSIYYTWYLSLRIRTSDASQLEERNKENIRSERKGEERKEKIAQKERK